MRGETAGLTLSCSTRPARAAGRTRTRLCPSPRMRAESFEARAKAPWMSMKHIGTKNSGRRAGGAAGGAGALIWRITRMHRVCGGAEETVRRSRRCMTPQPDLVRGGRYCSAHVPLGRGCVNGEAYDFGHLFSLIALAALRGRGLHNACLETFTFNGPPYSGYLQFCALMRHSGPENGRV